MIIASVCLLGVLVVLLILVCILILLASMLLEFDTRVGGLNPEFMLTLGFIDAVAVILKLVLLLVEDSTGDVAEETSPNITAF